MRQFCHCEYLSYVSGSLFSVSLERLLFVPLELLRSRSLAISLDTAVEPSNAGINNDCLGRYWLDTWWVACMIVYKIRLLQVTVRLDCDVDLCRRTLLALPREAEVGHRHLSRILDLQRKGRSARVHKARNRPIWLTLSWLPKLCGNRQHVIARFQPTVVARTSMTRSLG